jgi:hypothetical protein
MSRPAQMSRSDVQVAIHGGPVTSRNLARSVLDARFHTQFEYHAGAACRDVMIGSAAHSERRGSRCVGFEMRAMRRRVARRPTISAVQTLKKLRCAKKNTFARRHEYASLTTASTNSMTGSRAPPSVEGCVRRPRPSNAAVPGKVALALHSDRVRLQFPTSPLRSVSPHTED